MYIWWRFILTCTTVTFNLCISFLFCLFSVSPFNCDSIRSQIYLMLFRLVRKSCGMLSKSSKPVLLMVNITHYNHSYRVKWFGHHLIVLGYWRVLEADYAEQAVQHILTLLEEQDWHWTRVPLSATCHHLKELLPVYA